MPAYRFQAIDAAGRRESGLLQADSQRQARESLRARGLIALELTTLAAQAEKLRGPASLPVARRALMLGQLASILRAGVPLERALEACGAAVRGVRERAILAALRSDVRAGFPLSEALARAPRVFDTFSVAVVRAGERSGRLDVVIARLADHLEQRYALTQKIQLALIYPALLVVVSIAIIIGLLQFVIPQVAAVFAHGKQALPLLTRALLAVSGALKSGGLALLLGGVASAAAVRFAWLRQPAFRARVQAGLLKIPVLGGITQDSDFARTVSTLALLTGSGVPLVGALAASRDVAMLAHTRTAFDAVREAVEEGAALHRAMSNTAVFPPLVTLLVASGEESGRLPEMLDEAARRLADSVDVRVGAMVRLFEPAVVLVMGLAVLLIVLAVLLPIFEMNQLVK